MKLNYIVQYINLILVLGLTVGCSITKPYVFDVREFDRESSEYLLGISDRIYVTICTSNLKNNYEIETSLAKNECKLFGKIAKFNHYSYSDCPLTAIKALVFNCER
jgi:hypothetical protein